MSFATVYKWMIRIGFLTIFLLFLFCLPKNFFDKAHSTVLYANDGTLLSAIITMERCSAPSLQRTDNGAFRTAILFLISSKRLCCCLKTRTSMTTTESICLR